jgi:thiol-disulfide isomerase/thioredoxin
VPSFLGSTVGFEQPWALNNGTRRRTHDKLAVVKRSVRLVALSLALLGCDQSAAPRATESRVQAVLQPAAGAEAQRSGQAAKSTEAAPNKAVPKPRAAFCSGNTASPKPFTPKPEPRRVAAPGEDALPELAFTSKRWTWVNFWAAWCVPCKEELPLLLKWQTALKSELDFAFVSLDDDSRQLDQFLREQPATGLKSSYWLPDGPLRQGWLAALDLTSEPELPMQLLLDPSGKIRCRVEGAVEAEDLTALQRLIRTQD